MYNLNEHSRGLKEGRELAKCLQAGFMEICPSFQRYGKALNYLLHDATFQ